MNSFGKLFALGAVAAVSSSVAFATPITNNGTAVAATAVAAPSGTIVAQINNGILNSGTFTGTYTESVYSGTNTFGSGYLTFVISVNNDPSPAGQTNDSIERVSTGLPNAGFANFMVDAGYEAGTGPQYPISISEVNGALGFNFNTLGGNNSIAPGQKSAVLVINTNATNYMMGNLSAQDSLTANAVGYIPTAATPEPNSLMLLGSGLAGAAGMVFKRRRNGAATL